MGRPSGSKIYSSSGAEPENTVPKDSKGIFNNMIWEPSSHFHLFWINFLKREEISPNEEEYWAGCCARGPMWLVRPPARERSLHLSPAQESLPHLLVVGCFNVCDWDLLKFLSCPPQRAFLSRKWRVNAAIRRKIFRKVVLVFVFQLKTNPRSLKKANSIDKLVTKDSSPLPWPAPEVAAPNPSGAARTRYLWTRSFSGCFPELLTVDTANDFLIERELNPYSPSSLISSSIIRSLFSVLYKLFLLQLNKTRSSLVTQSWRICLPMQETQVWPLIWEDPTCLGATKPVRHNYWACALEPRSHSYRSRNTLEPVLHDKRNHCNKKPTHGS